MLQNSFKYFTSPETRYFLYDIFKESVSKIKNMDKNQFRKKVNMFPNIMESLKRNFLIEQEGMIQASLLKPEDLGATFEWKGETFEIMGQWNEDNILVQDVNTKINYQVTRKLVQEGLKRYNICLKTLNKTGVIKNESYALSDFKLKTWRKPKRI